MLQAIVDSDTSIRIFREQMANEENKLITVIHLFIYFYMFQLNFCAIFCEYSFEFLEILKTESQISSWRKL